MTYFKRRVLNPVLEMISTTEQVLKGRYIMPFISAGSMHRLWNFVQIFATLRWIKIHLLPISSHSGLLTKKKFKQPLRQKTIIFSKNGQKI